MKGKNYILISPKNKISKNNPTFNKYITIFTRIKTYTKLYTSIVTYHQIYIHYLQKITLFFLILKFFENFF